MAKRERTWIPLFFVLLLSVLGFVGKILLEKSGQIPSCILFHVEQWIFAVGGGLAFLGLLWSRCCGRSFFTILSLVMWISGSIIACYHAGVQYRFFPMPKAPCQSQEGSGGTADEKLASFLSMAPVKTVNVFNIPVAFDVLILMMLCVTFSSAALAGCIGAKQEE